MLNARETEGVILAILSAALWGVFPVIVNKSSQHIPPLLFATLTTLLAAIGVFLYTAYKGKFHELLIKDLYFPFLMITLCIQIIPYTLFFIGASKTSGLNTSMLLLSEIVFTLLFTPFIGEKTTIEKLVGALGVSCGAAMLLYKGSFQINCGDLLIILSTATYPIGNFYAKKALMRVSSTIILLIRFSVAAPFFFILSMLSGESLSGIDAIVSDNWPMLVLTGFGLLALGKIVWYEALERLDISKAISLSMTFPLFSLILLVLFYGEIITLRQAVGIGVMIVGAFYSAKRPSVDPKITKYYR